MKKNIINNLVAIISLLTVACSTETAEHVSCQHSTSVIKAEITSYQVSGNPSSVSDANTIEQLSAYWFVDGKLKEVFSDVDVEQGLTLENASGTLYMIGNLPIEQQYTDADVATLTEKEWLQTTVTHTGGTNLNYLSGLINLTGERVQKINLKRGVARVDIAFHSDIPVSVKQIVFKNVANQSFLIGKTPVASPESVELNDVAVLFKEPLSSDKQGVAYLCEQSVKHSSAVFTLDVNGIEKTKEVVMPSSLKRNSVYTFRLSKTVDESEITLSIIQWEDGGDFDAIPNAGGIKIDTEHTTFPQGTIISQEGKGITLPHQALDFVLSLDCDDELELIPDPDLPFTIDRIGGAENIGKNLFRITKALWHPGVPSVEKKLKFHRKGLTEDYHDDYIDLVVSENPVKLKGLFNFDESNEYNFGKYIDNELGVFTVPEDKSLTVEYEKGEDNWVKLEGNSQGQYRVLAGWRPNDPTANGRVQKAKIVITNKIDGQGREEYVISRHNWGLPVTYLNGIWWCKYNAMGDSKNFKDQILSSDDPAAKAKKSVFDYLKDCSSEDYFKLWKWQYQGKTTQGLEVINENGVAKMSGYGTSSVHINKLDPKAMAPDGYEVPSMENYRRIFASTGDYIWLMWDGWHTTAWAGGTKIRRLQRRRNDVFVDGLALPNLIFISMYNNAEQQYEPLVWYGSSAQWNDSGIKHGHYNNMLFAVANPDGKGWFFNGTMEALYATENGAGPNDTRILRFKKSDVEYIY